MGGEWWLVAFSLHERSPTTRRYFRPTDLGLRHLRRCNCCCWCYRRRFCCLLPANSIDLDVHDARRTVCVACSLYWRQEPQRHAKEQDGGALDNVNELDVEDQRRIGRNGRRRARLAVRHLRRDSQAALLADAHTDQSLVPACDSERASAKRVSECVSV